MSRWELRTCLCTLHSEIPGRRAPPRSLAFACPCTAVLGPPAMIAEDEQGLNACSSAADNMMKPQVCLVVELED